LSYKYVRYITNISTLSSFSKVRPNKAMDRMVSNSTQVYCKLKASGCERYTHKNLYI